MKVVIRSDYASRILICFIMYHLGLKAYIGANPGFSNESSSTFLCSKSSDYSTSDGEFVDAAEATDEFYDALSSDSSSSEEDSDKEVESDSKVFFSSIEIASFVLLDCLH